MYSLFKNLRHFWIILILGGLFYPAQSTAQGSSVTVSASVLPPFSTRFSYYINNPNKIQVFFINTSSEPLDVYIQGNFTGDNGIEIYTDPNYIPPQPVTLYPGVAYHLTQDNIGDVFSADHILYQGTSEQELMQLGGLPEGNYQFCFSVYDYNTHALLSDENTGCSNMIVISYIDPPVVLNPQCGDSIITSNPQNLLVSWTTPVGAGPNVKYKVVMTEMHPGDRNPNDALQSAVPPYFFEKEELTVPQLLIGPGDPPLMEGRSYAFYVQAYDPDNLVIFNNNGVSEACWFTYGKGASGTSDSGIVIPDGISDFIHDFDLIPPTVINGQLRYKLASAAKGNTGTNAPGGGQGNNSGGGSNFFDPPGQSQGGNNANSNHVNLWGGFTGFNTTSNLSFKPPSGKGVIGASIYDMAGAEPLRNTTVRLVVRLGIKVNDDIFSIKDNQGYSNYTWFQNYKFYNLDGEEVSLDEVLEMDGRVVDVCTTDDQGNYNFSFNTRFFTGPAYAVSQNKSFGQPGYQAAVMLRIEVENQKFCSPDVSIFAKPGDNVQVPVQLALIKDYDMHLTVVSNYDTTGSNVSGEDTILYTHWDTHNKTIKGGDPIPGATVKVMRDMQKIKNEHSAILLSEGQQLGSVTKNNNGEFKDIFIGRTDANGNIIIPHLVEHWNITDGENKTPYYFSIQTRPDNVDSAYEFSFYNYKPFFGTVMAMAQSVDLGKKAVFDDDAGNNGSSPVTYNYFYAPPASANDMEVGLVADNPEIKGRVMASSNLENIGLSDISVKLFEQRKQEIPGVALLLHGGDVNFDLGDDTYDFIFTKITKTNNSGFFRFKNLNVLEDEHMRTVGPYRRIQIESDLYRRIVWPPANQLPMNLRYGELFFKEFQLFPKQLLKGKVVDELGNPVAAYVRLLPNNPYVKTEPKYGFGKQGLKVIEENFEIPIRDKGNFIEILPLSNSYFPDTVYVNNYNPNQTMVFTVPRKMHRLRIHLFDESTDGVIANATVIVGDTLIVGKTNKAGIAELVFPSPGEQFLVRINAENYSPYQTSYNIPVSTQWTDKTVKIHYALHISGTVTDKSTGKPIDSALVYSQLQSTDGHTIYIEAYTDSQGHYRLNGLPWYNFPTIVHIHAVKSGKNPSYLGEEKRILVKSSMTTSGYDFALNPADGWDLSNIWGMPVTVEEMKFRVQTGTRISGYFHSLPHHPDLNTMGNHEKIYFKNLKVTKGPNGEIIPDKDFVPTEAYSLPIKINGGFTGKMSPVKTAGNSDYHLKVYKYGDNSKLTGSLKVDLSSFGFAYDFSGDIYVGEDTSRLNLAVFKSGEQNYLRKLYLFDKKRLFTLSFPEPISNFRVFGFNASSTFKEAYLQDGVIHIGTTLHTDIPLANGTPLDLKIKAGEIVITRDNMDLVHNPDNQLAFELEKWKVVSKNGWRFDKTRDAIVIPKATIFTGLGVDAGIEGLNIRPTALREGKIDLSAGLSLGGIKKLKLASGLEPIFNYDAGVGHYRISLVGQTSGDYVASVDNLPATNDKLEFTSIGMLSDNSTVFSLGKKMRFHNLIDVFVDQIMTGPGFFRLAGMPTLGIPGYIATRAEMTYTKENGKLKFKIEPLSGGADLNANTMFMLSQVRSEQKLTNKLYTSYGKFYIKPPPDQGGDEVEVKGFLTKTPTECYIDVIPQTIKMGKEKMDVIDGKISVVNGNWNELVFRCNTHSDGLDDNNVVVFNIKGGISVNSDNIQADEIETPIGKLTVTYLFDEKALVGKLTVTKPIQLGFGSLNSGMMETRFDPHGFYIITNGSVTIAGANYIGGFVLGVYEESLTQKAAFYLKEMRKLPPQLSAIHGFYVIGERKLIDTSFIIPVVPPIAVSVNSGVGAYVRFDYKDTEFSVGGYGYLDAYGGVTIGLCSISIDASAYLEVKGSYIPKDLILRSCGFIDLNVNACGLQGGLTVNNKIRVSTDGNNSCTFGLGKPNCEVFLNQ